MLSLETYVSVCVVYIKNIKNTFLYNLLQFSFSMKIIHISWAAHCICHY